ncbi:MAG: hypothetical protein JO323_12810 [Acidobacteriia bacterium]|nr:hypothetical protein [Terriglobia bacterium]
MKHAVLLASLECITVWAQPPAILQEGVTNSAGRIPPSLAGGSLAPGSRFTVLGLRLGTRAETKLRVQSGDRMFEAPTVSVDPQKLVGILPSDVPVGPASLVVVNGGLASLPFEIHVVPSSFGIFTESGEGWGPAIRSPPGTLLPGTWVTLQGTGLGGTRAPEVFAGGRPAQVRLARHTREPGIDEVEFQIPKDAPQGCFVPVLVETSSHLVSNAATVAVGDGSRECRTMAGWPRPGLPSYGLLLLMRLRLTLQINGRHMDEATHDEADAMFVRRSDNPQTVSPITVIPPPGTCTAYTGRYGQGAETSSLLGGPFGAGSERKLDIGPAVQIHAPWGERSVPARTQGQYDTILGSDLIPGAQGAGTYLEPGEYRVTAPGGPDGGPFSFGLQIPRALRWTNQNRISQIDRGQGIDVEWKNADSANPVLLLAANVDQMTTAAALAICVAQPEPGRFHIPGLVLANLPVTQAGPGLPLSLLVVAQIPAGAQKPIEATGIENAFGVVVQGSGKSVVYR